LDENGFFEIANLSLDELELKAVFFNEDE